MTAKLKPEVIDQIFQMHQDGREPAKIAVMLGCAYSTVVRYLNSTGIFLGRKGKGRPKELTQDYLDMAIAMRAQGMKWIDIATEIGFHHNTMQQELRARLAPEVRKYAESGLNATQIGTAMSIRPKRVQMIAQENNITINHA